MKRIGTIVALLIMTLSCSDHKVTGVSIAGRLLKSNGSPGPGIPVHLYWTEKTESTSNNNDTLVWKEWKAPKSSSDNGGKFTLGVNCYDIQSMAKIVSFRLRWGNEILHDVTNNGQPVEFGIDCKSEEINLGDLKFVNLDSADPDKLLIIGTLHQTNGSPIGGAKLALNKVTKEGKDILTSVSYNYAPPGFLVRGPSIGESYGNGGFFIEVARGISANKEREYAISFEIPVFDDVLADVLSKGKYPLLFKFESDATNINLGEITVETEALMNSKIVRTYDKNHRITNIEQQLPNGKRIVQFTYASDGAIEKKVSRMFHNLE
jgi:hypothetical protein